MQITLNLRFPSLDAERKAVEPGRPSDDEYFPGLCKVLQPGPDGIPFRHLISLEGVLHTQEDSVIGLLQLRAHAGASTLALQELAIQPWEPDIPHGREEGWELRFCAARAFGDPPSY